VPGVDPALAAGSDLLARGQWRQAHEVFEDRWRASSGALKSLTHALAQLGAALLKWSEDRPQPAATLLGRARTHLEGLPSRVGGLDVEQLEAEVQRLQEHLDLGEPAPGGLQLVLGEQAPLSADAAALEARCPYCGEPVTVQVEATGAEVEQYVEDCPVCCRPWEVRVHRDLDGPTVELSREDG
jgi:Cysteine-rich CPXCG/Domain of unknown function (DUF309)